MNYPKRLIEVDLPIKRISAHARREKSIRHGHISTLHIWWARRPLAACRAVLCAALWIDPADPLCPQEFREKAVSTILSFAKTASTDGELANHCSPESWKRWLALAKTENQLDPASEKDMVVLRACLLDFIADFANWDNSTVMEYLETSRTLTQAAHEALGGASGTKPLVIDPFAGGGSIPLEALRVGADVFASDLNPIPVLLNKVILEYIPKYGQRLTDEVRKWGAWIKKEAEKELSEFYPKDPSGATPIAYLWARTIQCEGPGCGAVVPLVRSLWLAKKGNHSIALRMIPNQIEKRVDFQIIEKHGNNWRVQGLTNGKIDSPSFEGTVKKGSASCPCCGYTTPVGRVRTQLKKTKGGTRNALLFAVVTAQSGQKGRFYRLPSEEEILAVPRATIELRRREQENTESLSLVPNEVISLNEIRRISAPIYGMTRWGDIFTSRQLLVLTTLSRFLRQAGANLRQIYDQEFSDAVQVCLSFAVDRQADYLSSLTVWSSSGEFIAHTFGRQAIPIVWEWPECQLFADCSGNWDGAINWVARVIENLSIEYLSNAHTARASATTNPLPDDSADALITDPPYYDSVPYAYLSDYFYVWLRRSLVGVHTDLFQSDEVPKDEEIVVDRPHELSISTKDIAFYERELTKAFADSRRVVQPHGIGTIVFASKTTSSWEAILQAVVESGWIITASWPIDTEREARVSAQGQARLSSSVHLVCRPRENPDGSICNDDIGDWRDVLQELPKRIHDWMPRLAAEGIIGADAIFACLGPALEIFSRYSRVEKASGEQVTLKDYLEQVWAVVAKEALDMIFAGSNTSGFEEDARLTAMWLWTLSTAGGTKVTEKNDEEEATDDYVTGGAVKTSGGFTLEFDAARKIAQGLGAHFEKLQTLVEIKGDIARLLPVGERAVFLFGKEAANEPAKKKKKKVQMSLFEVLGQEEETSKWEVNAGGKIGETVLDRLHQAMILFAAGRAEAVKKFLVDDGVGGDSRFWQLAQAFSALYPSASDEKRWVDGVLARKKGLGF